MPHLSQSMQDCIAECLRCQATCLSMATTHCLDNERSLPNAERCRLMLACAEICATTARFIMFGTILHKKTCGLCAEICLICAKQCEDVDGMEECVRQCRHCAEHCRRVAAS